MLQSALPVSIFAKNDVHLSLGGGTDCSFAPLIDYTIDVLGFYLKVSDFKIIISEYLYKYVIIVSRNLVLM